MSIVSGVYYNSKYEILPNIPNNVTEEFKKQGIVLEQRHSTLINYIGNSMEDILLGDGVFTKLKGVKLFIQTRDCIPLLVLGDGFCGLVHISWRNLYLGIYNNMFKLFHKENINVKLLQFIIGPHISEYNMEYNAESLWQNHEYYRKEAFLKKNGKTYFNMQCILETALSHHGVNNDQIISTGIDTFANNLYASYRRDGLNSSCTNIFKVELI